MIEIFLLNTINLKMPHRPLKLVRLILIKDYQRRRNRRMMRIGVLTLKLLLLGLVGTLKDVFGLILGK